MPLFMDIHRGLDGLTPEKVEQAHAADLEVQRKYGVDYRAYWYNDRDGTVFCLVDAPDAETARKVHAEAHGLVPDDIVEVHQGT